MRIHVLTRVLLVFGFFSWLHSPLPASAQQAFWTETLLDSFATGAGVEAFDVEFYTDAENDGSIILARATENFALDKSAVDNNANDASAVLDDNISTFWTSGTVNDVGYHLIIDLQAVRLVERINILGSILDPTNKRMKGYLIEVSLNQSSWTTVASNDDNQDKDIYTSFDPIQTRYIRITITKSDQLNWTFIGDVQVFGSGYSSAGYYNSKVKDLGQVVNFSYASWRSEIPPDTYLNLQFRTDSLEVIGEQVVIEDSTILAHGRVVAGFERISNAPGDTVYVRDVDYSIDYTTGVIKRISTRIGFGTTLRVDYRVWSNWSPEYSDAEGVLFAVVEPRQFVQYRVNLRTFSLDTPRLDEITLHYSTAPVAYKAEGTVTPAEVEILKPAKLTFRFDLQFEAANLGCDTVKIAVPSLAKVTEIRWQGQPLSSSEYVDLTTNKEICIAFDLPVFEIPTATLEIDFNITLFSSENDFPALILSETTPLNPQFVEQSGVGWHVSTTGIPEAPLVSVEIKPNPFSPNGDGIFDEATISFFVAKISTAKLLTVKVFDLNGDVLRTLRDELAPAGPPEPDIIWDGRDEWGSLVLPGPYLLQVRLRTDSGDEVRTKIVTVAY